MAIPCIFFCFEREDLIILNGTGDSHTVGAYLRGEKNGYKINLYKPILIKCPPKQSSIQKTKYLGVFQLCLVLQMMWCLHIAVSLCILCSIQNDLRKPWLCETLPSSRGQSMCCGEYMLQRERYSEGVNFLGYGSRCHTVSLTQCTLNYTSPL